MAAGRFITAIDSGKANNLVYSTEGKEGLVTVWKFEDSYILTWEECPVGEQYDESTYTRDERHKFVSVEQLVDFLADHGLKPEAFKP